VVLETERLYLREMTENDFEVLNKVLSDPKIMCHYPHAFDETEVRSWIQRNQVDEFEDDVNEITKVFAISRDEWIKR